MPHHQVGDIDVIHLVTGTLEATFEPEHNLPQIPFSQPIQLVDGLALCFRGDLGIPIDVGNLLHFYLQGKVIFAEVFHDVVIILIFVLAGIADFGCFPGDWEDVVTAGQRDAEVIVLGEAAAVQHVGPGEAESRHHWCTALLYLLAE